MPCETIASVKREAAQKLRDQRETFEIKIEALRRDHAAAIEAYIKQAAEMIQRNERQAARIEQLIDNGNERVLEQAKKTDAANEQIRTMTAEHLGTELKLRNAERRIVDLQGALSSASLVIFELGRRAEA